MIDWFLSKCENLKINFWDILLVVAMIYDRLPSKIRYRVNELPYWLKSILNIINYLGKKVYSGPCAFYIIVFIYFGLGFIYYIFFKKHVNRQVKFYIWPMTLFLRFFWIIYFVVEEIMDLHKSTINYWLSTATIGPKLNFILLIINVIILLKNLFKEFFPKYE